MIERTLSIIKPDAVENNNIGNIISYFEKSGLSVAAAKMLKLSKNMAGDFYAVHKERPFYDELITFMSSGPVVVMVLQGKDAVTRNRKIMGATNPKDAAPGTIRRDFAKNIDANAVHGSDSQENARTEIEFFFQPTEIVMS